MQDAPTAIEAMSIFVVIAAILLTVGIFISMVPDLRVWLLRSSDESA
jgi:hypothetical protein